MRLSFNTYLPDVAQEIVGSQGLITAQNVVKMPVGYKRAQTHWTIPALSALDSRIMGSILGRYSAGYGYKTYVGTAEKLWELESIATGWVDRTKAVRTGTIAGYLDAAGVYVTAVCTAPHGLSDGDTVVISGGSAYDGTYPISSVAASTFDFEHTWVGADGGAWTWTHYEYGVGTSTRWRFAQFGDHIIGVYGFTAGTSPAPQMIDMAAGAAAADLAANAPSAQFVMTVGQHLVLGNVKDRSAWGLGTMRDAVWWSSVGNDTSWLQPGTAAAIAAQTSYVQLYAGGRITALIGGEEAGYIFQEGAIWQMTYVGGPTMFEIVRVASGHGCYATGMVAKVPAGILFMDRQGLFLFGPNGPEPAGASKFANTLRSVLESSIGYDEYMMMYPDPSNSYVYIKMGDHIFVYDWRYDEITDLSILDSAVESLCIFRTSTGYLNPIIGTFDATHYLGRLATYMTGSLETGAVEPSPGGRATCVSVRPIVQGAATVTLEVATKAKVTDAWGAYGAAKSINSWGAFDCNEDGRFFKFRVSFSSGTEPITGLDVDFVQSGEA